MKRSATLVAALAALAVLCGAAAVEAQKQSRRSARRPAVNPTEVLAWVGDEPITRTDLEARITELGPQYRQQLSTPEGKRQLLDRMVEERVWMRAAERAGVPERPEVKRQIEQARMNAVLRTYVGELMQNAGAPGDSAIQAYYEEHKSDPMFQTPGARQVRHIQLPTEKDARAALAQLRRGADFAALARKLSRDEATKAAGGDVGRVERFGAFGGLSRQPALTESVYAAPLKVPSGPVKSTAGWHVFEVTDTIAPTPQPLESVRPRILQVLSRQTQESYYKQQLEAAKQSASFRWNDAAVESLLHGRKSAADLFREAQDAATPEERLEAYEQVVRLYPQSEQAPQAQFMIGFVYSEEKKEYDKAEAAFRKLLADYPRSELRNSAQWMLGNMRSDAVPSFELPGGVKRAVPAETDSARAVPGAGQPSAGGERK